MMTADRVPARTGFLRDDMLKPSSQEQLSGLFVRCSAMKPCTKARVNIGPPDTASSTRLRLMAGTVTCWASECSSKGSSANSQLEYICFDEDATMASRLEPT